MYFYYLRAASQLSSRAQSRCSKDSKKITRPKKKGFSLGRPCFYHGHKKNQQKSLFFGRVIFLESLDGTRYHGTGIVI